jgi:hypothetical protein
VTLTLDRYAEKQLEKLPHARKETKGVLLDGLLREGFDRLLGRKRNPEKTPMLQKAGISESAVSGISTIIPKCLRLRIAGCFGENCRC